MKKTDLKYVMQKEPAEFRPRNLVSKKNVSIFKDSSVVEFTVSVGDLFQ